MENIDKKNDIIPQKFFQKKSKEEEDQEIFETKREIIFEKINEKLEQREFYAKIYLDKSYYLTNPEIEKLKIILPVAISKA